MTQTEMAFARRTDPQTSKDAAKSVPARMLADRICEHLKYFGDATAHEIAERLGIALVSVSPRMKPLEDQDRVERMPKRGGRTVWRFVRA